MALKTHFASESCFRLFPHFVRGGGEPRSGNVERDAAELRLVRGDEAGGLLGVGLRARGVNSTMLPSFLEIERVQSLLTRVTG